MTTQASDDSDLRYLAADKLQLQAHGAELRLTLARECSWFGVKVVRAFPYTHPDRYLCFLDSADHSIGLVADPSELDEASRELVAAALARRYRLPEIQQIYTIRERFGTQDWLVTTNLGDCRFTTRDLFDNLRIERGGRITITDVDGNRYALAAEARMPPACRRLLHAYG